MFNPILSASPRTCSLGNHEVKKKEFGTGSLIPWQAKRTLSVLAVGQGQCPWKNAAIAKAFTSGDLGKLPSKETGLADYCYVVLIPAV